MQMFRSNSCRTGHYVTRGVRSLSGVKWIHRSQTWIISSPVVVPGPLGIVCFGDGGGRHRHGQKGRMQPMNIHIDLQIGAAQRFGHEGLFGLRLLRGLKSTR